MAVDLSGMVERHGLASRRPDLLGLAREGIRLRGDPAAGARREPGASRIGGEPDVPPGFEWPLKEGRPLSFVAQVNLDELPAFADRGLLPGSGVLQFFYDAVGQSAWGFDPKDAGSFMVAHHGCPRSRLSRRPPPDSLDEEGVFPPLRLAPSRSVTLPPLSAPELEVLELSRSERSSYAGLLDELDGGPLGASPDHRLLGHANEIQCGMQLQCQLVTNGLYCGDASGYRDPRARALRAGAADWRLLLQVDTDDDAGMMWGDCGRLFYLMRERDLRDGDFERAWLVFECY